MLAGSPAAVGGGGSTGDLSAPGSGGDSAGTGSSTLQRGELMLGLSYVEKTGRLSVEVIKGSNFRIGGKTTSAPGIHNSLAFCM